MTSTVLGENPQEKELQVVERDARIYEYTSAANPVSGVVRWPGRAGGRHW